MQALERLTDLSQALDLELRGNILPYWYQTMDRRGGGFFGNVRNDNSLDLDSPKGVVMHSRHLWAYSQAWMSLNDPLALEAARHARAFLTGPLIDKKGRGFWWTVDHKGRPEFENKVLYGQGFAIYGLAQYARATGDPQSLALAMETFRLLEGAGRDWVHGGYYEAVDRFWTRPHDQALSEVDIPCSKSMNTNLHILEAYSALYLASGSPDVRQALEDLLRIFEEKILVTPEHLGLYFDREWKSLTDHVSYGHDIEASWLMTEAAQILWGHDLPAEKSQIYAAIAKKSLAIVQANEGSLPNELHHGVLDSDRVWWAQAEAMVGMVNGWELTGDEQFLAAAASIWDFTRRYIVDREHGEWFWLVDAQGKPALDRPKGGLWKTSYHNGRACMEVGQRARSRLKKETK